MLEVDALADPTPRERVRVLLVDDDPTFRDLGVRALRRQDGLWAEAVATPRDALDALGERPVDAVASDVDLPGAEGDGGELYRDVRERWPALPFVFFTGTPSGRLPSSVDLRADPAVCYVRKGALPSRYRALARRIERVVGRQRATGPPTSVAGAIEAFCR